MKGTFGVLLFVALVALFAVSGMPVLDAVNHAFTTMPTGGFSTRGSSIGHYASVPVELICIALMVDPQAACKNLQRLAAMGLAGYETGDPRPPLLPRFGVVERGNQRARSEPVLGENGLGLGRGGR